MIRLTDCAFEPGAALDDFCRRRTETGAVASFVGIARGPAEQAIALDLEAWPGFTEAEIERFAASTAARYALHDLAIVHRIGPIPPGDAIVLVMTAAAHRREAFEACDCLMDFLKSRAPFWKKEFDRHGRGRWVEPTARDLTDLERWNLNASGGAVEEEDGTT